jgi:hypothetical protein
MSGHAAAKATATGTRIYVTLTFVDDHAPPETPHPPPIKFLGLTNRNTVINCQHDWASILEFLPVPYVKCENQILAFVMPINVEDAIFFPTNIEDRGVKSLFEYKLREDRGVKSLFEYKLRGSFP